MVVNPGGTAYLHYEEQIGDGGVAEFSITNIGTRDDSGEVIKGQRIAGLLMFCLGVFAQWPNRGRRILAMHCVPESWDWPRHFSFRSTPYPGHQGPWEDCDWWHPIDGTFLGHLGLSNWSVTNWADGWMGTWAASPVPPTSTSSSSAALPGPSPNVASTSNPTPSTSASGGGAG